MRAILSFIRTVIFEIFTHPPTPKHSCSPSVYPFSHTMCGFQPEEETS